MISLKKGQTDMRGTQGRNVFSVAQICSLSVAVKMVASCEDFPDATGARRLRRFNVQNLQGRIPSSQAAELRWPKRRKRRAPLVAAPPRCALITMDRVSAW